MPLTPETWLAETTVSNTGTDTQSRIVQLANGNILVVWTTGASDLDVVGQIFDPFGTAVGGQLSLATLNNRDEYLPDITALPDGGFSLVASEDFNGGELNDIRVRDFDATGTLAGSGFAFSDVSAISAPDGFQPAIAASSATSALVLWSQTDGSGNAAILGRIWNPDGNSFAGAAFTVISGDIVTAPATATLTNGNYVIAATSVASGSSDSAIRISILNDAGGTVLSSTAVAGTSGDTDADVAPSVTALTGGGFVLAWQNTDGSDTDVLFQVFTSAGATVGATGEIEAGSSSDDNGAPVVVALSDGGFLVLYQDSESGDEALRGARFDASGTAVGSAFAIATGSSYAGLDATLLADGRVAISYEQGGAVQMQIVDTRDAASFADMLDDTGDYQVGTTGNDLITAEAGAEIINAHDGDDTVVANAFLSGDSLDGGAGTDTFDGSAYVSPIYGFYIDMANETGDYFNNNTQGPYGVPYSFTGFENLIGSDMGDVMLGDAGANEITGNGGNDQLSGAGGADVLNGGAGEDTMDGGTGNDTLIGGAQNDSILGGDGDDEINGGLGADDLSGGEGNDLIVGGNKGDTINGDGGNDVIGAGNGNDEAYGGTGDDVVRGGDGDDMVNGGDGRDTLLGGVGVDVLIGGDGNDTLKGRGGFDVLEGGAGNDLMTGGNQADQFIFADGFGNDVITDFNATNNAEGIDLSAVTAITDFADLMANHIDQVGADVYIDDLLGNTIRLVGVNLGDLDAADFDF